MIPTHMSLRVFAALCFVAMTFGVASSASAQDKADASVEDTEEATPTKDALQTYHDGRKSGSIAYMAVGGAAALSGGVFALTDSGVLQGAAIPLATLGLIDVVVGAVVYSGADEKKAKLDTLLEEDSAKFKSKESDRLGNANIEFDILRAVDTLFLVGGLSTAAFGQIESDDGVTGVGYGLAVMGAANLVLNGLADNRAGVYLDAVEAIEVDESKEGTANTNGAIIGVWGQF